MYKKEETQIYSYWNGTEYVCADPLEIYIRLEDHPLGNDVDKLIKRGLIETNLYQNSIIINKLSLDSFMKTKLYDNMRNERENRLQNALLRYEKELKK